MAILRRCVVSAIVVVALAACGSSSSSSSGGSGGSSGGSGGGSGGSGAVTIGASLSLSGDFAADGQAFQRGYQLWAADQNAKGGLLGHKVKLDIISDSSSASQVVSNYQKLIGSNKDGLVFGPFSTLLTVPSARIAARYGYAFVEGAGAGPPSSGKASRMSSPSRSRSRTAS
jgi:branched-chain amino acid transport system substrate-binding protein